MADNLLARLNQAQQDFDEFSRLIFKFDFALLAEGLKGKAVLKLWDRYDALQAVELEKYQREVYQQTLKTGL